MKHVFLITINKVVFNCCREKFYASIYYNPLVNAVAKQCPEIAKNQRTPYEKRLTGDEIINVLCNKNCERLVVETDHGMY